ncbi:UNVERIFIED_CONTAM: hypothetical protein FKN15_020443 [Acipenser sinensis]
MNSHSVALSSGLNSHSVALSSGVSTGDTSQCHGGAKVQEQVYSELCDVLGSQRYPLYSDRDRLPFLTATINEVLRLRPVAPLAVPHRATRDSSIAGYFIPKDTVVIPNLYAAHHHPREWTDPHSFRPERFVSSLAPRVPLQCLVPFGVGARLCLGEAVARMELFLFTAHLLRDFKFLPPHGQGPPDLTGQAGIVLKARPFLMKLSALHLYTLLASFSLCIIAASGSQDLPHYLLNSNPDPASPSQSLETGLLQQQASPVPNALPWRLRPSNLEDLAKPGPRVSERAWEGGRMAGAPERTAKLILRKTEEEEEKRETWGEQEGEENERNQALTSIAGGLQSFNRQKGGFGFRFGKKRAD